MCESKKILRVLRFPSLVFTRIILGSDTSLIHKWKDFVSKYVKLKYTMAYHKLFHLNEFTL